MYAFYKVVNEVLFHYNDVGAAQADDEIRCSQALSGLIAIERYIHSRRNLIICT